MGFAPKGGGGSPPLPNVQSTMFMPRTSHNENYRHLEVACKA